MPSEAIVDNKLLVRLDLDHSLRANSFFQVDIANRAHLASQLLLYETIIIPTIDFGIIPTLINWFGLSIFEEMIDTTAIKFVRRKNLLGYVGNGNGINTFTIISSKESPFKWWQEAIYGENLETSIEIQIKQMCPFVVGKERQKLINKISEISTTLTYDNDFFIKNIVHESYVDIMNNQKLRNFILSFEKKNRGELVNLTHLSGIAPNQLRVLAQDGEIKNAVDLVLRVAEINMEILISTSSKNADIFTSTGSEKILAGKLSQHNLDKSVIKNFISLLELKNIPDIRQAINSGDMEASTIWSLRKKKHSAQFRRWLRESNPQDSRDLEKAYVRSLEKTTLADSLPLRVIRFAITSIAGVNPVAGLAIGGIDNFFVDKWLSGYSPKLFLDELSQLFKNPR